MSGVAEEETIGEQDRGPLTYQESKVFYSQPHICSVYDNETRRVVTFEVYGLDTQDMLHLQYQYTDFDGLFRFNAELMNPNRKAGRYHWVIERLEIALVGGEQKLRLANEVTKEVPELPKYEETRKIPTGRMDLKERQRLREQMDKLNIKREENIRRKRQASKAKFLESLFAAKDLAKQRAREVEAKIERDRQERYRYNEEVDAKEEEEARKARELAKVRYTKAEQKDNAIELAREEDLRQLRLRWKAADAEKARLIAEAHERKERERAAALAAAADRQQELADVQAKREAAWEVRDRRVEQKLTKQVNQALAVIPEQQRMEHLRRERNQEYLDFLDSKRHPVFEAQLQRQRERQRQRELELEQVRAYEEGRAIPKKEKTKGRHAQTKRPDSKSSEVADEKKESAERIVDAVELKMRQQMEEQKRRAKLDKIREENIQKKTERYKKSLLEKIQAYKAQVRDTELRAEREAAQRKLVLQAKRAERQRAEARTKAAAERLRKIREANVAHAEHRQLVRLSGETPT